MAYSTLITGSERRRRWSEDQKLALLDAAFAPGASVADVARQADICTSLLYRWRQSFAASSGFAPVVVRAEPSMDGPSAEPAVVVEFTAGPRVLIAAGAPVALVAAALRALR